MREAIFLPTFMARDIQIANYFAFKREFAYWHVFKLRVAKFLQISTI